MEKLSYLAFISALRWLLHPGSSATIVLLTVGVLLAYVEFNRPGWIVPGATGLLLCLLAAAAILKSHPQPFALALLVAGGGCLLVSLCYRNYALAGWLAAAAWIMAFCRLGANPVVAVACGLALGLSSSYLARIARRARANKGLDLRRARSSRPGVPKF